jgi:glycosyltransferase A (GT-A) superfamily protein (DUF2064 family)
VSPAVLVMAKAPVPGAAKTRLGAVVGHAVAAELAAACILDTLDVCEEVFPSGACHVALAGELDRAAHGDVLAERLGRWTVHPQRGDGFAARLAHAHEQVARHAKVPVVQLGMDTPHLPATHLSDVGTRIGDGNDAVLGAAVDGGWWVLAVTRPDFAQSLQSVEMSTERTYGDTLAALRAAGATVAPAALLRDVDTPQDADASARAAPGTRFARRWAQVR